MNGKVQNYFAESMYDLLFLFYMLWTDIQLREFDLRRIRIVMRERRVENGQEKKRKWV